MDVVTLTDLVPSYRNKLDAYQERLAKLKKRLDAMDLKTYRTAAIFDQLVFQLQQALSDTDLYSLLEIEYADTYSVFE